MAEPLGVTTGALPITNATTTDFTQRVDAADARLTATQLPLAVSHGLQSSPLNRLPPELRNKIWKLVMVNPKGLNFNAVMSWRYTNSKSKKEFPRSSGLHSGHTAATACSQIAWALSLMATCRQIRSETKYLLLDLNDINIQVARFFEGGKLSSLERSIAALGRIPSSLGREMGRVALCLDFDHCSYKKAGVPSDWKHPELQLSLIKFSQAIHPFRLFLGLDFRFSGWGNGDKQICARDAPVTLDDCTSVRCNVPFSDRALALRAVDESIDRKLGLLQRHGSHRICAVRAMIRTLESGLEVARQYMREVVDLFVASSDAWELALTLQQWEVELL